MFNIDLLNESYVVDNPLQPTIVHFGTVLIPFMMSTGIPPISMLSLVTTSF